MLMIITVWNIDHFNWNVHKKLKTNKKITEESLGQGKQGADDVGGGNEGGFGSLKLKWTVKSRSLDGKFRLV